MTNLPPNSLLRSGIGQTQIRRAASSGALLSAQRDIYSPSNNPNSVIRDRVSSGIMSDSTQYTFPSDLPPIHMNIIETDWKTASKTLTPRKLYKLPLPLQLKDSFDVQYDPNFAPASNLTEPVRGLGSATVGRIVNSFRTVTLAQPNYRRHQFAWKLAPKNFQESERIQRIIFNLRRGMTPKREANKVIMRFPFIYLCYFSPNPKFLYKMKPTVLERIDVDYNGGNPSPAFYRAEAEGDQAPESVTITLTFLELEYWLDSDNVDESDYKIGDNNLPTNDGLDSFNYYKLDPAGGSLNAITSTSLDGVRDLGTTARQGVDTFFSVANNVGNRLR